MESDTAREVRLTREAIRRGFRNVHDRFDQIAHQLENLQKSVDQLQQRGEER